MPSRTWRGLLGGSLRLPELALVLPMGISFYTFQTLSYTVDVYRGQLAPVRSFPHFLLFVSFFPQLVAGPIVRASEFLPQIDRPRRLRLRVFYEGAWLVICGFFLKMVCADNLAAYVDEYWWRGARAGTDATFALWLGVMFSGQIFADFCGYSTIARGLGYLLGYRFPINFDAPYIAGTFKNFWERWHITLSRWLRDYLYRPLGGNRRSRARTLVNLLVGDAARRPVARRGVHLHRLGSDSRRLPRRGARVRAAPSGGASCHGRRPRRLVRRRAGGGADCVDLLPQQLAARGAGVCRQPPRRRVAPARRVDGGVIDVPGAAGRRCTPGPGWPNGPAWPRSAPPPRRCSPRG